MEEKLARLVFDYSKSNKDIDKNFIEGAFAIIASNYDIDTNIEVTRAWFTNALACYYSMTNTIHVYKSAINSEIKKELQFFKNRDAVKNFKYIYFLHALLHEAEHAMQILKYKDGNVLEQVIVNESINAEEQFYNNYYISDLLNILSPLKKDGVLYQYDPKERLAEFNSAVTAETVANIINDTVSSLSMQSFQNDALLSGYNVETIKHLSDEPTISYFNFLKYNADLELVNKLSKDKTDFEKMKLGLATSKDCIQEVANRNHDTIRKLTRL